ncbi:MAG: TonB-dependent receptor [Pseudomonadota bacterium]
MQRTLLAACLAGLFSCSAQAETIPELGVILVTATRFESAGMNTPIAAQIITAEDIRDSSAKTVSEILHKLGGVHTRINFTGVPDTPLDLRGFGMTGDQNTLVLVNGQRISENGGVTARLSALPIDAIERIEILRGSGAVLYGGGATAGTINIITRAPAESGLEGNISATAGSHDLRDLRGGLKLGSGPWGLAVHLQDYGNDNYRDNNRAEQRAGSAELRYGSDEGFIVLGINADDQKARLPGARTEAQLDSDPRGAATPDDFLDSNSRRLSLRGERQTGDLTLALDLGYQDKHTDMFNDSAFGSTRMGTDVQVTTLSPRLLWTSSLSGAENRFTIGADWSDWSYDNDTLGTGFMSSLDEEGAQKNRALYVRDEVRLSATTRLSLGARRENVSQTQSERLVPRPETTVTHHLSAYEIALKQGLGAGFSAYGRLGRSFRVGNIDENRCWFAPCPALLKPQRSRDRELGLEWQGMGAYSGAKFRAGLFDMAVTDEIHYNALTFSNMNLSPTRHRGLELEGSLFLGGGVDLAARYTRTQARFRSGVYGGQDVSGNDVPLVPRDRLGLNLGWLVTPATRLGFNLNYVGRQRYDNDQANRFRTMPSYTVADVKLSHETGAWRLEAGVNNLFDRAYYSYGIVNGSYTSFNAYPEDRRNAYVSAEYRF